MPWKRVFTIAELIIHYKYNSLKIVRGKHKVRKDYDIALIRLDYPLIDEESGECGPCFICLFRPSFLGMTATVNNRFSKETIMPICLPSSDQFKDTNRRATAVGMGIKSERLQGHRDMFSSLLL